MKNIQSFDEFVNESILNEKMVSKTAVNKLNKVLGTRDLANVDLVIAKLLNVGIDMDSVAQVDEYAGEEYPAAEKIYNFLEDNFSTSSKSGESVDGYEIEYDPKLNVVRATDTGDGFISYYFTINSKF
jgi:hypothetical protein